MIEDIASATGLSERQVEHVLGEFCRRLHRDMYEYDDGNGDFLCEELLPALDDFAWLHLYQFLLLAGLRYGTEYPEDDLMTSSEMLERLGGAPRWAKYFHDMKTWKMSSRFGFEKGLYS